MYFKCKIFSLDICEDQKIIVIVELAFTLELTSIRMHRGCSSFFTLPPPDFTPEGGGYGLFPAPPCPFKSTYAFAHLFNLSNVALTSSSIVRYFHLTVKVLLKIQL